MINLSISYFIIDNIPTLSLRKLFDKIISFSWTLDFLISILINISFADNDNQQELFHTESIKLSYRFQKKILQ